MSRPRVLMLSDQLGHPGGRVHGLTTYFVTHLPALQREVDLQVCFLSPPHPAATALQTSGVQPRFLGRQKWDPRSLGDVARTVRAFRPDLIHLLGEKSFIAGALVGWRLGIPSLIHLHDATPLRPPLRLLQRRLSGLVRRAVVVSEELRFQGSEYGFAPEKVRVLYCGVAPSIDENTSANLRSRVRAELGLADDAPLLGIIGRVSGGKGQLVAIQAMETIVASRPDAKLAIVGEGPGRSECEAAVDARGLAGNVVFTGQRGDIEAVMAALDLVLMPSMVFDAMPLVSLESIAAGRPVVAFDSGGIRNAVVHGVTGTLVPLGDVEGLARETLALIEDPSLRDRYGRAGREHARRFTVEAHVAGLLRIYAELLSDDVPATSPGGSPAEPVRKPATSP